MIIHVFSLITWTHIGTIISAFLLIGFYMGFRALINLKGEYKNLQRAKNAVQGIQMSEDDQEEQIDGLLSEQVRPTVGKSIFTKPIVSLVWERIRNLEDVKENAGRFDRQSMSIVTRSRLRAQTASMRYIAGILILIGLFGTLCGLTNSVSGLRDAVEKTKNSDLATTQEVDSFVNDLRSELNVTLGGMRMAFVSSLLGVLSTIILTGFVSWLNRRQLVFLAELESFTTIALLPRYLPRSEALNFQLISEDFKQSSLFLKNIFRKLKTDTEQERTITTNIREMSEVLKEFISRIQQRDESIFMQLGENIDQLTGMLDGSFRNFSEMSSAVIELKNTIGSILGGELEARDSFLEKMNDVMTQYNNKLTTSINQLVANLKGEYDQSLKSSKEMRSISEQISKTMEGIKSVNKDSYNVLLNLKKELVAADHFESLGKQINSQTDLIKNIFTANGQTNGSIINKIYEQINASSSDDGPILKSLHEQQQSLGQLVVAINQHNQKNNELLTQIVNPTVSGRSQPSSIIAGRKIKNKKLEELIGELIIKMDNNLERQEYNRFSNRMMRLSRRIIHPIKKYYSSLKKRLKGDDIYRDDY